MLYQRPGAKLTDTREKILAGIGNSFAKADTGALHILSIMSGKTPESEMYGVVVKNQTDTVVTNQVVAFVVRPTHPSPNRPRQDTIEYLVSRLEPNAVMTISGGHNTGEGAIVPIIYPATRIVGRHIADADHKHRVSWMPRVQLRLFPEARSELQDVPSYLMLMVSDSATSNPKDFEDLPSAGLSSRTTGRS